MNPERWQKVDGLLQAALAVHPNERLVFIDRACAGDATLRDEVLSLLSFEEEELDIIDTPALEVAACLMDPLEPALSIGEIVSHYQAVSLLGSGGMGEVYLADDTNLGRRVALKLLPPEFTRDQHRVERFQQEARTASALNHPNILTIHEIGTAGDRQFIATEFVEGETLRQRLRAGRFKLSELLDIATQVAGALAAAHKSGIVHRDIKPENIMIRPDGLVKVLDFGLAELADQDQPAANAAASSGLVMGTLKYMSPEQAQSLEVDYRSDIFSLGSVLYELATGKAPFEGQKSSDVVSAILNSDPEPIPETSRPEQRELQQILNRALQKERKDRYQSIDELISDLKGLQKQIERASELEHSSITDQPFLRRALLRWPIVLLVVIIVVMAIALAFKFIRQKSAGRFQTMEISRVSTSGLAFAAAISPDGKSIVYAESDGKQSSLWLRQIETAEKFPLAPPAPVSYGSLAFSHDGGSIFYVNRENNQNGLYQMAISDRSVRKLTNLETGLTAPMISLSPDEQRLAYAHFINEGRETALVIARIDGSEQRQIATRTNPNNFSATEAPAWSPDGKTIVAPVIVSDSGGAVRHLLEVEVENGSQKLISGEWFAGGSLDISWLPDGSGLIVVGRQQGSINRQIWHVSYPDGEARRITNDLNDYSKVSLAADSNTLASVQLLQTSVVWVFSDGDTDRGRQITFGPAREDGIGGLAWTLDGRIVHSSGPYGNRDIWIMNADGTDQKQLTFEATTDVHPAVSPDGRYVVFTSERTGGRQIWRMETTGNNPKQLSTGTIEQLPVCSPDGQWVVYQSRTDGKPSLWRVSIEGGQPAQLSKGFGTYPAFSPDGQMIASYTLLSEKPVQFGIAINRFADNSSVTTLSLSFPANSLGPHVWTPDGKAIAQLVTVDGVSNIWICPLDGNAPAQLTKFKSGHIFTFDWSRDGKQLAIARGNQSQDVVLLRDFR